MGFGLRSIELRYLHRELGLGLAKLSSPMNLFGIIPSGTWQLFGLQEGHSNHDCYRYESIVLTLHINKTT